MSISFILVCGGLAGSDWLGCRLDGLRLAASLGAAVGGLVGWLGGGLVGWPVGGPVGGGSRGLLYLEVLPGAQQRRVVDQRVQQLPARDNPPAGGRLVRPVLLNP